MNDFQDETLKGYPSVQKVERVLSSWTKWDILEVRAFKGDNTIEGGIPAELVADMV